MRLRKVRERDFGFDAAGRLCELSRADRNRKRRGLAVRTIGAKPTTYTKPPDAREWQRAFATMPASVALMAFDYRTAYSWAFNLSVDGAEPLTFVPSTFGLGITNVIVLDVLGRRKHPRRAAVLVAQAVRLAIRDGDHDRRADRGEDATADRPRHPGLPGRLR